jgi:hypothetical protein
MDPLHPDLFGGQTRMVDETAVRGPIKAQKKSIGYVQQFDRNRQCRHCTYLRRFKISGRTYYKCQLIGITNSAASDVRLFAHCRLFEHV